MGVVHVVVLPSREVWCPAWVLARCSGRQLLFRLTAVVGPSGTGMTWSWSQRWAGVVQIGVVQVPSRQSTFVDRAKQAKCQLGPAGPSGGAACSWDSTSLCGCGYRSSGG